MPRYKQTVKTSIALNITIINNVLTTEMTTDYRLSRMNI